MSNVAESVSSEDKVVITLPDGSAREYPGPVTGQQVAADIGPGLAKAALAVKVDGEMRDLTRSIPHDARLEIVTRKSDEALELLRHDCAHIMAEAVQELYPGTQITFGPAIEDGFYYDFYREEPFTPDDFEKIEARMQQIVDRDEEIVREVWDRNDAIAYFKKIGEDFKAEHIGTLPVDAEIS
ncbi:MAG: TGS domain-containing protein, partial [Pseudomonadota bacterium]